ncbi:AAA domain containing protein [uncultured Caudovirales phage]|uniref:AAA domain containing protein n=1 Tax=uncultured Caudovirales phage TaxID=2100421 RepID=A0A6J5R7X2_9CAUD|nr:AAA domain containing protein [uncultured Caudovirales phage]CAB4179877.1 AAA domain containing protein [uncultured Caudovirales phage]CAB4188695.1 AAA domain containing protein [uncultured Caudovirales phage]
MSIALLVESVAPEMDGLPATNQTLLFGYQGEVLIYHRISNGTKGRGQVWTKATLDDIDSSYIAHEPVAVMLNDRDLALVGFGQITNIANKALYANESASPIAEDICHNDMVADLIVRLNFGHPDLADYLTDKRRSNGVIIEPVVSATPVVEEAKVIAPPVTAPIAKYEQVEAVALEEKSLSLAMISVPDAKWANEYVNRKIDGVMDWDIFDRAMLDHTNVLIEGGAGSGKTISVQSYASARKLRYFNISSNNGIDPSQLFGRWIPNPSGVGYIWQDGAVTQLFRYGGVLLINEVNFLPVRVSTVLFSALDYRREIQLLENGGEVIKAHPNLLIVADMNNGYRGTQPLNQAFADRFGIKLEFNYDRAIETKVVGNKPLLELADQLRSMYDLEEIATPISTRGLVDFISNAKLFGIDFAITSYVTGFDREERSAVRLACETHKANIAKVIGVVDMLPPSADFGAESYNSVVSI